MYDLGKTFTCNRSLLRAKYRESSGFSFLEVAKEFYKFLEHMPVHQYLPHFQYGLHHYDFNINEYKDFREELDAILEYKMPDVNEIEEQIFEDYVFPYAIMFLTAKEYDDDLLSYLYIVGTKYCNTFGACEEIIDAQEVLDSFYENKLTRQRVIEIVARFLVIDFMVESKPNAVCYELPLEDYEQMIAERETK